VHPVLRRVALLALVACGPPAPLDRAAPARWLYPPAPVGLPLGTAHGRLGRSQRPQAMLGLGIAGPGDRRDPAGAGIDPSLAPLDVAMAWPIPGDGPALAAIYGRDGDRAAIDLIELDAGRAVWRDAIACAGPIVAATRDAIACSDGDGTRAIGLDGALRWATASRFLAATGDRIALDAAPSPAFTARSVVVLDLASGDERARIALPRGVAPDAIAASCGDTGRELFAIERDGRVLRIADAPGGPAIAWTARVDRSVSGWAGATGPGAAGLDAAGLGSAGLDAAGLGTAGQGTAGTSAAGGGAVALIEPCGRPAVVVALATAAGRSLIALARDTGALIGRVDGVLGWWPARDGSDRLEIATATGVASYPPALSGTLPGAEGSAGAAPLGLPVLGELIAARGDRRLVRATPLTAVLLDRAGVRGYLALAASEAVLGDRAIIATRWTGRPGETVRRMALPPRLARALRLPPRHPGVAVDAELRDLPPVVALDLAGAITQPDTGTHGVVGHALDPEDAAALYAVAVDRAGERAALVRADLAGKQWRWQRVDGCGEGAPVGLAVAREVVVCATQGTRATLRATSRDGVARWQWTTEALDAVAAAGDAIAVRAADRLTVLDARDGRVTGRIASDDGAAVRATVVATDATTLVIAAERGRVVARLGTGGLLPLWSVAVAGTVRALAPSGPGVLVVLEDGDAYRIDARSAAVTALPGLGLAWNPAGDLVTGDTLGGPIPGPAPPAPPPTVRQLLRRPLQILRGEINTPAPMSTPIAPPPPLGDSWQLAVYELTGGLRARNDYAISPPIAAPAVRGPPGSPLVVPYGPGLREVVVLDPRTGDPLRRIRLPEDAAPGAVFGTVVDGSPVAGAVLAAPLRVVLF
jgi:hypothetical protein